MKIKRRNFIEKKAKRDTYERRIDACLVIQVAENDFTSSNLHVYTVSYVAILLLCNEWNVGYIRPYKIIFMTELRRKGYKTICEAKKTFFFVRGQRVA